MHAKASNSAVVYDINTRPKSMHFDYFLCGASWETANGEEQVNNKKRETMNCAQLLNFQRSNAQVKFVKINVANTSIQSAPHWPPFNIGGVNEAHVGFSEIPRRAC